MHFEGRRQAVVCELRNLGRQTYKRPCPVHRVDTLSPRRIVVALLAAKGEEAGEEGRRGVPEGKPHGGIGRG